jgi:hypothetical protein
MKPIAQVWSYATCLVFCLLPLQLTRLKLLVSTTFASGVERDHKSNLCVCVCVSSYRWEVVMWFIVLVFWNDESPFIVQRNF